jgi:hypothetical protein
MITVAKSAFAVSLVQEFLTGTDSLSKLFEHTHSYAVDFESLTAIKLAEWTCRMDLTIIFADDAEKVTVLR